MTHEASLNFLAKAGLYTLNNVQELEKHRSPDPKTSTHLDFAIEIAVNNNFLSQQILNDFFANIESACILADVLKHFHTADLVPDKNTLLFSQASSSVNIKIKMEAELQVKVYQTMLQNLQHLGSLEFNLRYLAQSGLIRANIDKVLKDIPNASQFSLALHNLSHSTVGLTQTALNAIYADPKNASEIAKKIYSTPVNYVEKTRTLVVYVVNAIIEPQAKIEYVKPPRITFRR